MRVIANAQFADKFVPGVARAKHRVLTPRTYPHKEQRNLRQIPMDSRNPRGSNYFIAANTPPQPTGHGSRAKQPLGALNLRHVSRLIQELINLRRIAQLDFDHPAASVRVVVDRLRRGLEGVVGLDDLARER